MLSKKIIETYGLRYYLHVVNLEFRKQSFSIFSPDEAPVSVFYSTDFENTYQNFLQDMSEQLDTEFKSMKFPTPRICLQILVNPKNFAHLEQTLLSINQQIYKNYEVKILLTEKMSMSRLLDTNQNISKISIVEIYDSNNEQSLFLNCEYVGILKSGTILSPYTLLKFAKELNDIKNCDVLYSDHDEIDEFGKHTNPFFKPDWNPYLFLSMDYLSPFYIIRSELLQNFTSNLKNCIDFDMLLQCLEKSKKISHIPLPLISSFKNQDYSDCKKTAIENHLKRISVSASVEQGILKNTFRIKYKLSNTPKVSIIIPTKNNYKILKRCLDSIKNKTNYKNWEIIIVDNSDDSMSEKKILQLENYYKSLPYTVIKYDENFNFSKMNNLAAKSATGDLLLFLNDDTKVLDPYWLDELVSIVMQDDVGAVGPKLVYSDDTIQHAGMVFLKTGAGFHPSMKEHENSSGYHNMINVMREYSAVTGACLLTKKEIFDKVGGFDDIFDTYYGDSDLCLAIKKNGFRIIYTPFTKLLHEGSFSISNTGVPHFAVENHLDFINKWSFLKDGDPFYNENLGWNYALNLQE